VPLPREGRRPHLKYFQIKSFIAKNGATDVDECRGLLLEA
jgi:hypothetical protein